MNENIQILILGIIMSIILIAYPMTLFYKNECNDNYLKCIQDVNTDKTLCEKLR